MSLETELLESVKQGKTGEVKDLLEQGADIRHDSYSALREAAFRRDSDIIKLLINYGDQNSFNEAVDNIEKEMTGIIEKIRESRQLLFASAKMRASGVEADLGD